MIKVSAYVVGYRYVDFTNDKGEHISGTSVWLLQDSEGVFGKLPVKVFVKGQVRPPLGDCVASCDIAPSGRLRYNNFFIEKEDK